MPGIYIDNYYENASPLKWDFDGAALTFCPLPDYERFSGNFQVTWWNFRIITAQESLGQTITVRLRNAMSCWNGKLISSFDIPGMTTVISRDHGGTWETIIMEDGKDGGKEMQLLLDNPVIQVARITPYTIPDLEKMLDAAKQNPLCRVEEIGRSVEGRPLDILSIGDAPDSIFLRGRSHPWESGGSWVIQGLVDFLCSGSSEAAEVLRHVSFHIMPMAAIDGVYRGMTRFTVNGFDLNRGWGTDDEFDAELCPENACLMKWFETQKANDALPKLAFCLHNDAEGKLHLSHPDDGGRYLHRMEMLDQVMRAESWYAEGAKSSDFFNPGTFGEGVTERFAVDALVWELNADYAVGLDRPPTQHDWLCLGEKFAYAVYKHLEVVK